MSETPQPPPRSSQVNLNSDSLDVVIDTLSLDSSRKVQEAVAKHIYQLEAQHQTSRDQLQKSMEAELEKLRQEDLRNKKELKIQLDLLEKLSDFLLVKRTVLTPRASFAMWRARFCARQFTYRVAVKFSRKRLIRRHTSTWQSNFKLQLKNKSLQQSQRFQHATQKYERELDALKGQLEKLQAERSDYAEQLKQAVLRGVCALNIETMSAFNGETRAVRSDSPPKPIPRQIEKQKTEKIVPKKSMGKEIFAGKPQLGDTQDTFITVREDVSGSPEMQKTKRSLYAAK